MKADTRQGDSGQQELLAQVDELNDRVKTLAINLAIYLAKTKTNTPAFSRLEPEFIKLINGTLKVVQELTAVINASRSEGALSYEVPSGNLPMDSLETKMRNILDQCTNILGSLGQGSDSEQRNPAG